ncbi:hypothetical protein [Actinomadura vinacea]|uniref:hypothetical protein n=1 Tax=Actinomadura vinacea TaxID=115336 RepID=UPI0031D6164C
MGAASDSHQYWLDRGPLLQALHHSPQLLTLAELLSGRPMAPFQAAYLYYPPGAYCGLHTDRPEFELQMLVHLRGDIGPLLLHPELASASAAEIAEHGGARTSGGGVPLTYPEHGVTVFRGAGIPHERPLHHGPDIGVVLALNYHAR